MRPVRWATVKLKAQQEANIHCGNDPVIAAILEGVACKTRDWRGKLTELQELVWDRIKHWDIRRIRKLHELFPSCLPRDCKYVVDYDDKGEWTVFE